MEALVEYRSALTRPFIIASVLIPLLQNEATAQDIVNEGQLKSYPNLRAAEDARRSAVETSPLRGVDAINYKVTADNWREAKLRIANVYSHDDVQRVRGRVLGNYASLMSASDVVSDWTHRERLRSQAQVELLADIARAEVELNELIDRLDAQADVLLLEMLFEARQYSEIIGRGDALLSRPLNRELKARVYQLVIGAMHAVDSDRRQEIEERYVTEMPEIAEHILISRIPRDRILLAAGWFERAQNLDDIVISTAGTPAVEAAKTAATAKQRVLDFAREISESNAVEVRSDEDGGGV